MLQHPEAESAESNKWRAQYVGFSGRAQTTVPDFVIEAQKMVYECKPERLHNTPLVQLKATALRQKLTGMGYGFELVDPGVPSYDVLTELIDNGRVRLATRTEKRYREWQV